MMVDHDATKDLLDRHNLFICMISFRRVIASSLVNVAQRCLDRGSSGAWKKMASETSSFLRRRSGSIVRDTAASSKTCSRTLGFSVFYQEW